MTYLGAARTSLFRFEYLQDFSATDSTLFAKWQKAGNIENDSDLQSWWDFLNQKHHEGVVTSRVRLVEFPISEYTSFELQIHRETARRGDDVRIITRDQFDKLAIPYTDFWIIDDVTVIGMRYGNHGKFEGLEKHMGNEDEYRVAKKKLIAHSVPIAQFPSSKPF